MDQDGPPGAITSMWGFLPDWCPTFRWVYAVLSFIQQLANNFEWHFHKIYTPQYIQTSRFWRNVFVTNCGLRSTTRDISCLRFECVETNWMDGISVGGVCVIEMGSAFIRLASSVWNILLCWCDSDYQKNKKESK